jgi:hypothetical protein
MRHDTRHTGADHHSQQDVLPNPFFGTKSKNKNQNNNQNHGSDGYYNPNHLVPTSRSDHTSLNRPNSEEFGTNYDPNTMTADERHMSLPNLDQLTDDDINVQFESMLVSMN